MIISWFNDCIDVAISNLVHDVEIVHVFFITANRFWKVCLKYEDARKTAKSLVFQARFPCAVSSKKAKFSLIIDTRSQIPTPVKTNLDKQRKLKED